MGGSRNAVRAAIFCVAVSVLSTASAGEPAKTSRAKQREAVEAILSRPVDWTPRNENAVTIDEFVEYVRDKHGLAIRWDVASLQLLSGGGHTDLFTVARQLPSKHVIVWNQAPPSPHVQTYSPVVPARLEQHVTNFSPPPNAAVLPAGSPEYAPPPVIPEPDGSGKPDIEPGPSPVELQPVPIPEQDQKAGPATKSPEDENSESPHRMLSALPIDRATIALTGATVGETLTQLLEAAVPPMNGLGDEFGVPLNTMALRLDYIVDGRSVVITTKLRANAQKETRVYRIGALKGLPPEQLAKTICHSIRPWSWRSQAGEIADRLAARFPKGNLTLPQVSMASSYLPDAIVPASGTIPQPPISPPPLPLNAIPAPSTSTQSVELKPQEINPQELAALGQLLTGGAIAAVDAVVNTLEILHYGDPPTGVMEVLPGVLVITQSQGAHREIAELLEELAATAQ